MSFREGLREITLGELCVIGGGNIQTGPFGSQLHASDYLPEGIPSIMPKNISVDGISTEDIAYISEEDARRLSKYLLKEGDIIYSRRGDVEKCTLISEREEGWLCGTGCLRIRLGNHSEIEPSFVQAYLSTPEIREWIVRHAIGATMPNLNTSILSAVTLKIPPLELRNSISGLWTNLTNKINLNRQINQTLETMAQALFKSWFVDFEPVRAKVAALELGEDPTRAAMRAISGKADDELDTFQTANAATYAQLHATASLFPDEFEESELGMIPKDWEVSEIGNEVDVVGGGTPSTSNPDFWENGTINWTSPKDLSGLPDKVLLSTASKITVAGLKKISSGLLPINTVLMSSRAPVGYLALSKIPVAINQGYIAMKCTKGLTPEYTLQWALSVMEEIKQRASGSTFAEISKASFRPIKVIVPSNQIIEAYTKQANVFYNLISQKAEESNHLSTLRDTLLPKLLSGELTVGETTLEQAPV